MPFFAARSAGYSKDDSSYHAETGPGPRYGGMPLIAELTQICDIPALIPDWEVVSAPD